VAWLADPPGPVMPPRVAFAVGRQVGGAVDRNRVRRRLRAIAREARLPAGAWLIGAGAGAATATHRELRSWFGAAVQALEARR